MILHNTLLLKERQKQRDKENKNKRQQCDVQCAKNIQALVKILLIPHHKHMGLFFSMIFKPSNPSSLLGGNLEASPFIHLWEPLFYGSFQTLPTAKWLGCTTLRWLGLGPLSLRFGVGMESSSDIYFLWEQEHHHINAGKTKITFPHITIDK
jgi:hypothetical protein